MRSMLKSKWGGMLVAATVIGSVSLMGAVAPIGGQGAGPKPQDPKQQEVKKQQEAQKAQEAKKQQEAAKVQPPAPQRQAQPQKPAPQAEPQKPPPPQKPPQPQKPQPQDPPQKTQPQRLPVQQAPPQKMQPQRPPVQQAPPQKPQQAQPPDRQRQGQGQPRQMTARLPQPQQQLLIGQQQQRLMQYGVQLDQQQRLASQHAVQLQQQKRPAQYNFQLQYTARLREQQRGLQNAGAYNYYGDPYFYTPANYRYSRGGRFYQTNDYGATVLRQAVNYGYEEGFEAGRADRQDRWAFNYQDSYAYQDGNFGYGGFYIDRNEYNFYFREGFRRGYEDGFYSRYQYGVYTTGHYTVLGGVLSVILNFQPIR